MIKIWSMKKNEESATNKKNKPKKSAAEIRVQKDLNELELPSTMKTEFPDTNDLLSFNLYITPDEGLYKGGKFPFSVNINKQYPHEPPKVKCTKKVKRVSAFDFLVKAEPLAQIYHPNIDLEGNVCLNILREDWKPVLNLNAVVVGLQYLFLEPNPDDPLNKDAAKELKENRDLFKKNVDRTMGGYPLNSIPFEDVRDVPAGKA